MKFQEFCWTDKFSSLKERSFCMAVVLNWATPLRILGWIQLISNLLLSFISLLWDCNLLSFSLFCWGFFLFSKRKTRQGGTFVGVGFSPHNFIFFSWSVSLFSLFPFSFFVLTFLLTFPFPVSCLKDGLAPPSSSTLLFLKIRVMTDCFFPSSFIYLSTPVSFTLAFFKF